MAGVPFIFGNATTSIPLTNLDANFNTGVTIGNTTVGLGNTVTTLGNVTLTNATVSSASITDSGLTSGRAVYTGTGGLLSANANLTYDGTTFTAVNDASISGLAVGKGGGAVSNNTVVGTSAGVNQTGSSALNTFVGYQAGSGVTSANSVTCIGSRTGNSTMTGGENTLVGDIAGYSITSGSGNSFIGKGSGQNHTTGTNCVALGVQSLFSNTTATQNTAVGYQAGNAVTTGGVNTFLGWTAGNNITTGTFNTYIGYTVASAANVSYEIVIGNAGSATTGKGGNTGFINPNGGGVYQGNNSTLWSITSDERLKKNIVDNSQGLDKISAIQVRNFEYRLPEEITEISPDQAILKTGVQLGAIAQELQQILPECVKQESTGIYTVDADPLIWYLINSVKELNAKVTALETQLGAK